jgi:hypothetical protein
LLLFTQFQAQTSWLPKRWEDTNNFLRLVNIDASVAKKTKGCTWHELATEPSARQNQKSSFLKDCGHFMPHDVPADKTKIRITQANQIQQNQLHRRFMTLTLGLIIEMDLRMNKFYMMVSIATLRATCLGIALLIVSGCDRGPTIKLTSTESQAFNNAPADVKQAWQNAVAADVGDDYLNAQKLLDGLKQMQLSDEQKKALDTETAAFHLRLWEAAEKNDPAAVKAAIEINKSMNTGRN